MATETQTTPAGSEAPATASGRSTRLRRYGTVFSAGRNKTIGVRCDFSVRHPKYGKLMKRTTKLHAHDEKNEANVGDRVELVECRPLSKTKNWRLAKILERAPQGGAA